MTARGTEDDERDSRTGACVRDEQPCEDDAKKLDGSSRRISYSFYGVL